ncbi:MAG: hypothetical protein JWM25_652 [Thermoleophilia bacterium]|nr:hypothetical protein [Thermoleophilia bacterium]MCZ4496069.1 hypothetical protein [Thermoleophilia bacterium]
MQVSLPTSSVSAPTPQAPVDATPPQRWARWWTSPIASIEYGTGSRATAWSEAWIPANRNLTGRLTPSVSWGGSTKEAAIEAAHALAAKPIEIRMDMPGGRSRLVKVHPAIAVLRDAKAGAFWLAPLRTSVLSGNEWVEAPHTIDGGAFTGRNPVLLAPVIRSATRDMVAVVGRDRVATPQAWKTAPDDSFVS